MIMVAIMAAGVAKFGETWGDKNKHIIWLLSDHTRIILYS